METAHLAALVAVADAGSLSRAAQQRKISISSISRQIADLEQTLGTALLLRTGRGVRLTPAGEGFVERARFLLRDLEQAIAEAAAPTPTEIPYARLSSPQEIALSLLPQSIASFHKAHPTVRLDVYAESRKVSLLEESYDAALRLGSLQENSHIARLIGDVALILCGPAALRPQRISIKAIQELPFVGVTGTNEQLTALWRKRSFSLSIRPILRVSTFSEAADLAVHSQHAVVLPSYTASRFFRMQQLMPIAPSLQLPSIPLHMILAQRHRKTLPLQTLCEILRTQLAEHNQLAAPSKPTL
jgi:DNA-binding transcriptional LysR family regulator